MPFGSPCPPIRGRPHLLCLFAYHRARHAVPGIRNLSVAGDWVGTEGQLAEDALRALGVPIA